MISIFNGRKRTLGGATSSVFVQVSVEFRQHLHELKGARLAVFMAIALHADENGWAWPSRALLSHETGYTLSTITDTLGDLCRVRIGDQRILLRHQPQNSNGTFKSNRYLIFPSTDEIACYENCQPELPITETDLPLTGKPLTVKPLTVKPLTENQVTKKNHIEQEPDKEELAEAAAAITCSIHNAPMTLKVKDNDSWYSHQLPSGSWCKGAARDQRVATSDSTRYISGEFAEFIQH